MYWRYGMCKYSCAQSPGTNRLPVVVGALGVGEGVLIRVHGALPGTLEVVPVRRRVRLPQVTQILGQLRVVLLVLAMPLLAADRNPMEGSGPIVLHEADGDLGIR